MQWLFFIYFPNQAGKTTFVRRLIENQEYMLDKKVDKVYYFYTELNKQIKKIAKLPNVEIIKDYNHDYVGTFCLTE